MSKFILFKRDDVDPYFRRITSTSDIPIEFRDRVKVDHEAVIIDQKRIYKRGIFFNFNSKRIDVGNPFTDDYMYTPLGFVPKKKTFMVSCVDGVISFFIQDHHSVIREHKTIDDPIFDDVLYYSHSTNKVYVFRDYYKEKLQV